MVKVVDGGAGSAGRALRERFALDGMVIVLRPVVWRFRRSVAAWGMKAWPSRLKGRTNGSTCEGLDTQV